MRTGVAVSGGSAPGPPFAQFPAPLQGITTPRPRGRTTRPPRVRRAHHPCHPASGGRTTRHPRPHGASTTRARKDGHVPDPPRRDYFTASAARRASDVVE